MNERYLNCNHLDYGGTPDFIINIIEATHIGMWDWHIINDTFAVNDVWAQILGYERESLSGVVNCWRSRLYHEDADFVNAAVERYISGEIDEYDIEYRMVKCDGTIIWVQEKGTISQRDTDGTAIRFIGTLHDISRHKETEHDLMESQRYRLDLEKQIKDAARKMKVTDNVLRAKNDAAALLLASNQANHDIMLTESLRLLGAALDVSRICLFKNFVENDRLFSRIINSSDGESLVYNFEYDVDFPAWRTLLQNRKVVNYNSSDVMGIEKKLFIKTNIKSMLVIPLFFKDEFWGCMTFVDFEKHWVFTDAEIEAILSAGALLLSSVIRNETTANLIAAKEAALESTRAKSAFLANMSHELRTPLSAIIGMSAVAHNSCGDEAKITFCLEKITTASKVLLGMICDVLDMSKIENQRLELTNTSFSFDKLIRNVCDIHTENIKLKNQGFSLEIDKNIPKTLIGDDQRLAQVINKLVSNAIKFTPDGGSISVEARELERNNNISTLLISVVDNGIGIDQEMIDGIFTAFQQLGTKTTRVHGGAGLGLAISKSIVNCMNGDIWVQSRLGDGSKFSFTVKLEYTADSEDNSSVDCQHGDYDFTGKSFLVVDDIDINRMIIEEILTPLGAAIDCANNGKEAVNMFEANPDKYSIILMDLQMPVMDGFKATEAIRNLNVAGCTTIPIVAMTANAFSDDIESCLRAGMNNHISKPIDIDKTMKIISRYVN